MKFIHKYLILFFLITVNLYAKSFLVNEPILNSKVHVELFGDKKNPPMVFVHGLGNEASTIWEKSISKLKDRYYIMSFDLPGFGKSSKEKKPYNPKNYAQVINYLTTKYINKPFILVGHSLGGAISLKFSSMFPKKVDKLVLIDVAGVLHKVAYSKFLIAKKLNNSSNTNDSKLGTFFEKVLSKADRILPFAVDKIGNPPAIAALALSIENFSGIPESIKQKTLIVWGENDDVAPIRTGYVLDKLIPNSQLKVVKRASHLPMTSNFDEYYRYLDDFLKGKNQIISKKKAFIQNDDLVVINNERNRVLTGIFKKLVIKKSKNILLKDCIIDELIMYDSDAHLINSRIQNKELAIKVEYSNLLITTSVIKAKKPIVSQSSRLDIAGSTLIGENSVIFNMNNRNNTHVVFSLSKISSKDKTRKMHKKIILVNHDKI